MRDRAEAGRNDRRRDPDTRLVHPLERLGLRETERLEVDLNEVRLDLFGVDRQPGRGEALAEPAGAGVVVGEPVDVVLQRVDTRRGHDAGLAHRPPEHVLETAGPKHQLGGAGDDGAERAAEALRQADRHRVGALGDPRSGNAERDRCVEEPRAVEVEPEAELAAAVDHGVELLERPDAAAGAVVGVLDRDDSRLRRVEVVVEARRRTDLLGADPAVLPVERPGHETGEGGRPAELRDQDVGALLGEQLVARLAVEPERDLVRHRRRGDVDGLLVTEKLSRPLLEQVDGRVFPLLLVADLGRRHRLAHCWRRLRLSVRPEVDHGEILPAARRGGTGQRRPRL